MATKKSESPSVLEIPITDIGELETGILGLTPYLHNRMAEKAKQEILFPKGRKNAVEKATTLKHDPVEEFRASPYTLDGDDEPTLLAMLASNFKGAMMTAALDLPGVNGRQIGRLITVQGYKIPFWGDAQLHMAVTRSADMNKTPDIRTRAISPEWATIITVRFVKPLITHRTVVNLLTTGGQSAGVGDWRPQKGKGTFGQFKLIETDKLMEEPVMKYDRTIQAQALQAAEPFDGESRELFDWYVAERKERGR